MGMETLELPKGFEWFQVNPQIENLISLLKNTNQNLNIIGPGGVGKSTILKMICGDDFFLTGNKVVLSSTGISAINASSKGIKGMTIHSFFKFSALDIYGSSQLRIVPGLVEMINRIDVLIIDEVSMVTSSLFDFIIETLMFYRSKQVSNLPRILLFGDILQLPPVINKKDKAIAHYYDTMYDNKYFYFNSMGFKDYGFKTVHLDTIYRQSDVSYQNILNRVRQGTFTLEDLSVINDHQISEIDFYDKSDGDFLYVATTNANVNMINDFAYQTLEGDSYTYEAIVSGNFDLSKKSSLLETVNLKVGLKVMVIRNAIDLAYQNGMIGTIDECEADYVSITSKGATYKIPRMNWEHFDYVYDEVSKSITTHKTGIFNQIALKPASALTVHKTQSQTLNSIYLDLENYVFAEGLVYVALSRVKDKKGLGLKRKIKAKDILVSREALDFLAGI
jgi:hypothetical protein